MNLQSGHEKMLLRVKVVFATLMIAMITLSNVSPIAYSNDHYPGKVYYVSANGADTNPGTIEAPWRTIQKAADTLMAGETVLVRGGVYEEFVTIRNSGSAAAGYITFQAYPGEQAVIEGKNLSIASGKSSLMGIRSASYIVVQGFEIRGLATASSSEYPAGVKIQGGGSNIHILNNNIHHIENRATRGNAHGLLVYGDSANPISDIKISGNEVHHLINGSSESLTLVGNVKDFSVDHNIIHDNNNIGIDIAGFYNTCSSPCQDQARNGVVAYNLVYNIDTYTNPAYGSGSRSAAGIYVDGGTNVVIENNEVFNSNFGVELASEQLGRATSNIVLRNNYLHHNQGAGLIMGGSGTDNGGAANNLIVNNTLYMNDALHQGYGEITLQHHNNQNIFANNILYTFPKMPFIRKSGTTGGGNVIDHNLYYRTDGVDSTSWRYDGVSHKSWNAFKQTTGFDQNSIFADPLFIDIEAGNLRLAEQSPAINTGTLQHSGSITHDYYNQPRIAGSSIDMGAAEFDAPVAPEEPAEPVGTSAPQPTVPPIDSEAEPTPTGAPASSQDVIIDGASDDWALIPELTTGGSNARGLKAFIRNDWLYVLVTGNLLNEKGQLFISLDTNETTFAAPYWVGNGSEYMIENGILYKYSGEGGSNWNWSKVVSYTSLKQYAVNATAVEYAIALSDLNGVKDAVSIGYAWKDSAADKLPSSNQMAKVSIDGELPMVTPKPTPIPTPEPTPVPTTIPSLVTVDGKADEWSQIAAAASGSSNVRSIKLTNDAQYLYMLIEGAKLDGKLQVYLNSDASEKTGYQTSRWTTAGIDYLLESGRLYRYSGKGKEWSFNQVVNLSKDQLYVSSSALVELAIPLANLNVAPGSGQTLKLGVLLNDNKNEKFPTKGEMLSYSLK
ncbi:right-handed parallel beta-helix repeat-containing protein [Paenibacillus agaridevorans]|uniref:right-handed parallel beta-helix repeat-containing protein n=1 Tax=Paenibacillus agaridevorans TaxID=171404 RepID=UPI001BE4222F|nr:right-handed parallel beta-helix repeat-containing protein [Paenibacillus agaridevorans]